MPSPRLQALLALAALAACGGDDDVVAMPDGGPDVYVPFADEDVTSAQVMVARYQEMVAVREAPDFDQSKCGDIDGDPAPGTLAEIYVRADPTYGGLINLLLLQFDHHDYNREAPVGTEMNVAITRALEACAAGELAPLPAAELVDKTLQRFFYVILYTNVDLGATGTGMERSWDRAFGYGGRSADGAESLGLAATAAEADGEFGLDLDDTLFALFIAGRGQLAAGELAGLRATADEVDRTLILVLAYMTAHEFIELPGEAEPAVELAEGIGFFAAIEPSMREVARDDADWIRAQLDQASFDDPTAVDAAGIVARIEAAFGIDATP